MSDYVQIDVPAENLFLNSHNPRYVEVQDNDLRGALCALVLEQGDKLLALAEDIGENGLNPSERAWSDLPILAADYQVLEGNRRLASIKLLITAGLIESLNLPPKWQNRWKSIWTKYSSVAPRVLPAVIVSPEKAKRWIELKHTGENSGVGVVPWDATATARWRGPSKSQTMIQSVAHLLPEETRKLIPKISITTLDRLLSSPSSDKVLASERMVTSSTQTLGAAAATVVHDVARKDAKRFRVLRSCR